MAAAHPEAVALRSEESGSLGVVRPGRVGHRRWVTVVPGRPWAGRLLPGFGCRAAGRRPVADIMITMSGRPWSGLLPDLDRRAAGGWLVRNGPAATGRLSSLRSRVCRSSVGVGRWTSHHGGWLNWKGTDTARHLSSPPSRTCQSSGEAGHWCSLPGGWLTVHGSSTTGHLSSRCSQTCQSSAEVGH